jgi:hypothetical protein
MPGLVQAGLLEQLDELGDDVTDDKDDHERSRLGKKPKKLSSAC